MMDQELLSQPNVFMLSLLEAIEDELAFYSQDKDGKFVYLSKSAEKVLNLPQDHWKGSTFHQVLSDAPCNQELMQTAAAPAALPAPVVKKRCEILDREGKRIKLEIWQIQIVYEGVPIGLSGIIRRLQEKAEESYLLTPEEEEEIAAKVAMLTAVERKVIELVVDGHMNKRMAASLDVAVRTIESRRSRAMSKLDVGSLSQLVQLWVHVRRMESRNRTEA